MLSSATFESCNGGQFLQPSELHFPGARNDRPTATFPAGAMNGKLQMPNCYLVTLQDSKLLETYSMT